MSPRETGVRQARRDDVTARILRIGREHLARHGAAGLSLRAVTRDVGMVSSAVYRYVADRDALLTLLVVDAYTALADAVEAEVAAAGSEPWDERIVCAAAALRAWAVAEPARYALIYGSPVPGYEAPGEQTIEPGTRVMLTLLGLVAEGVRRGEIQDADTAVAIPPALREDLEPVMVAVGLGADAAVMSRTVLLWSVIIGGTSLEVFGQWGKETFAHPGLLFEHQVRSAIAVLRGTPTLR